MAFLRKLLKKPWEKTICTFEVQEYGTGGERGWHSITQAAGNPPTIAQSTELFQPGMHYRCIARAVEGEGAGTYIGIVWKHYEPVPGGLIPKEKEKPKKAPPQAEIPIEEAMDKYAEKLTKTIEPIVKITSALDGLRETLFAGSPASQGEEQPTESRGSYEIPPPRFDGSLPQWMHPYVAETIGKEVRATIDHFANRFGLPHAEERKVVEEEEEPLLPSIKKFEEKGPLCTGNRR